MHSSRAGCPFVISQKDEKKFKEILENPERFVFAYYRRQPNPTVRVSWHTKPNKTSRERN